MKWKPGYVLALVAGWSFLQLCAGSLGCVPGTSWWRSGARRARMSEG